MRFICDATVGKLARYLRMLGFDTLCVSEPPTFEDGQAPADPPTVLTRNRTPRPYQPSRIIKADTIDDQVREIADLLTPGLDTNLFMTRCLKCNCSLRKAARREIEGHVPEYIFHHHRSFTRCPDCGKIYWEGTHTDKMRVTISRLLTDDAGGDRNE